MEVVSSVVPQDEVVVFGGVVLDAVVDKGGQRRRIGHEGVLDSLDTVAFQQIRRAELLVLARAAQVPDLIDVGVDGTRSDERFIRQMPFLGTAGHYDEVEILVVPRAHDLIEIVGTDAVVILKVGTAAVEHDGARYGRTVGRQRYQLGGRLIDERGDGAVVVARRVLDGRRKPAVQSRVDGRDGLTAYLPSSGPGRTEKGLAGNLARPQA